MLLCISPSNQEVKTLPEMVYDWTPVTHGATPEPAGATAECAVSGDRLWNSEEKTRRTLARKPLDHAVESSLLSFRQAVKTIGRDGGIPKARSNSTGCATPTSKPSTCSITTKGRGDQHRPANSMRIEMFREAFLGTPPPAPAS